jgi:recombination protein RecT
MMATNRTTARDMDRAAQDRAVVARPSDQTERLAAVQKAIDQRMKIMATSAAAGIDPDRLALVAMAVCAKTPALLDCEPVSLARSLVEAAQLGLEPTGLLGGAYLVPRGGKATLMIGYKGLVILAMRSKLVQRVEARVVRDKDAFDYEYGLDQQLYHHPSRELDPGSLAYAYAVIVYRDGERQFDVMSAAEIEQVRKRSSAGQSGPWVTDYFEMAKKTVLRRLLKLAPLTIDVAGKLDELDPESGEAPAPAARDTRATVIQAQLRDALEATYGEGDGGPGPAATPAPAQLASGGGDDASVVDAIPAADPPEPLEATCGAMHAPTGMGPCVLEPGHVSAGEPHRQRNGGQWR